MTKTLQKQLPVELRNEIKPLADAGFALHWLHPGQKNPIGKGWSTKPRLTLAQLESSYAAGNNIGLRPGPASHVGGAHLVAIDFDCRVEAELPDAYAALKRILPEHESLPCVQSGSANGLSRHYYFFADVDFSKQRLAQSKGTHTDSKRAQPRNNWEIDLCSNTNLVLPPSIHPDSGQPYTWIRRFDFEAIEMGVFPFVTAERLKKMGAIVDTAAADGDDLMLDFQNARVGLTIDQQKEMWNNCDWEHHFNSGYLEWIPTGMAMHHENDGSDDGLKLWLELSSRSDKFDEGDAVYQWKRGFKGARRGKRLTTIKTFMKEAYANGWKGPDGGIPFGDLWLGQAFARAAKNKFIHVPAERRWIQWNGARWATCELNEQLHAMSKVIVDTYDRFSEEFKAAPSDVVKEKMRDAAGAYLKSELKTASALRSAQAQPAILARPDDFDRDGNLFACGNGVLDLRTLTLAPPNPAQMIRRGSHVRFDPDARAPKWEAYLARVLPDAEVRSFLQECAGYTLTSDVTEEKWFALVGNGGTGKSVACNVLQTLLGDYATAASDALLLKRGDEREAEHIIAGLPGKRAIFVNELPQGVIYHDGRIKSLVSREKLSARPFMGKPFEFAPSHKLWLKTNNSPGVHDGTDGFFRRLCMIRFPIQIPEQEKKPELEREICERELAGVLNWAIEGLRRWRARGRLAVPQSVKNEVTTYRELSDVLGAWIAEETRRDAIEWAPVADAYSSYVAYCEAGRVKPSSKNEFSRLMHNRGFETVRPGKAKRSLFQGLALNNSFDDLD